MKKLATSLLALMLLIRLHAQETPVFKPLRYDEDYSYFKSDTIKSYWYKNTKFQPLSKDKSRYISFGGDFRYQYFYFNNEGWGKEPKDKDGYLLSRFLGHADFHTGDRFRVFAQLQSSLANGKINSSPVDENQLELHQLFADAVLYKHSGKQLTVRLGRQEMQYGSQRVISTREGPNNRQSFDGTKLMYTTGNVQVDGFFTRYVQAQRGIFDDHWNKNLKFWGAYGVINNIPLLKHVDLYYLGIWRRNAAFDKTTDRELRHSAGTRIWNDGRKWSYDVETIYQWGKFGEQLIAAWTLSSNTTYRITNTGLAPEFNLKADIISGNKGGSNFNTFNPLFPRGAYFGYAAIIGPSNLMDIHPTAAFSLTKKLIAGLGYDIFWRYSTTDGIYGPGGTLLFSGKDVAGKYIGDQWSVDMVYTPNSFMYFRAECTWFDAGTFLKNAGPGKDILFTGATLQVKF
ncbi:MAG: alginate export family protein [Chitinophagaceae bacterium]